MRRLGTILVAMAMGVIGLWVPGAVGATLTFSAEADARVQESSPSSNFGTSSTLRVEAGSDPDVESYLRFTVTGVSGSIQSATLRVFASSGTENGPAAYSTTTTWTETGITWANRTPRTSSATDDKGAIASGTWVSFNVTSLVPGNGTFAFVLAGTSSDGVDFHSREGTNKPQLILEVGPPADTTAPTAPGNLRVTASPSTVELSWDASTDDTGVSAYDIYRNASRLATVGGGTTSYSDAAVVSGETYSYQVYALDAAGHVSEPSNTATVTVPAPETTAPTPPTGLTAEALSATRVDLSWIASTDEVGVTAYDIYREGALLRSVDGTTTTYSDTTAAPKTPYSYFVRARDGAGNVSDPSNTVTATTPADTDRPSAPTSLTATAVSSTRIDLAWGASTDNVGVTNYRIYREGAPLHTVGGGVTSYSDTTAAPKTTYSYFVTALDGAPNESDPSNTASASTPSEATLKPNFVFIIADDMRADQYDTMPTVSSELVAKGREFRQAFAVDPLCCPARISILRGQYSHTTSVYDVEANSFGGWSRVRAAKLETSTLGVWLQAAGYRTGLIGKYLNGYTDLSVVPPGWNFWRGKKGSSYTQFSFSEDGKAVSPGGYEADVITNYATQFISTTPATQPLFLYAAYYAPHNPHTPPARYDTDAEAPGCANEDIRNLPSFNEADMSDKPRWSKNKGSMTAQDQLFYGKTRMVQSCQALLAVDDGVKAIIAELAKTPGRLENTFFVFTSDQGIQNGQHRHLAKKVPYEESARIPFVVRYDALPILAGTVDSSTMLANIDLAPTVLDLAGVSGITPGCPDVTPDDVFETRCKQRGGAFDGTSFAGLLTGTGYAARQYLLIEHWNPIGTGVPIYCSVRSHTGKLTRYFKDSTGGPDYEGYNLATDPNELNSVVFSSSNGIPQPRGPAGEVLIAELNPVLKQMCDPLPPDYPAFP